MKAETIDSSEFEAFLRHLINEYVINIYISLSMKTGGHNTTFSYLCLNFLSYIFRTCIIQGCKYIDK